MASDHSHQIAVAAAQLVADEGMEYAQAKRKAARTLGRHGRSGELPSNESVENEVRAHIALFQADTQPAELAALRQLALAWMERLAPFRPHLSGAAWRGTANRHSAIHLDLYCDDPKSAEIGLLNQGLRFDTDTVVTARGEHLDVLSLAVPCAELADAVTLHLTVRDLDDLRGALKPDAQGRSWRGDLKALRGLLAGQSGPGRGDAAEVAP